MYRYKIVGSTGLDRLHPARTLVVFVAAKSREDALDRAFDDMGLMAIVSVRKIGKQLRS